VIEPYVAVCVQNEVRVCSKRSQVMQNVERCSTLIDRGAMFFQRQFGERVRLVAFPEYHLQDWRGVTAPWWDEECDPIDVCITIPGDETEALAKKAKQHGLFIVAHALEIDPHFPGYFFNCGFIINPDGQIIYKRRKTEHAGFLMYASPHDVLDRYMEIYGKGKSVGETIFPVVDTEIGKLGMAMCYEMIVPELHRQLTANGAEVVIRPTAEMDVFQSEPRNISLVLDRARAIENVTHYVVPHLGPAIFPGARDEWAGASVIVNYDGTVLAEARTSGETLIGAVIDVERQRRVRANGANYLAKSVPVDGVRGLPLYRPEVYDYWQKGCYPPNLWKDRPQTRQEKWDLIKSLGEKAA
jgi:predicted amidohydrolase